MKSLKNNEIVSVHTEIANGAKTALQRKCPVILFTNMDKPCCAFLELRVTEDSYAQLKD